MKFEYRYHGHSEVSQDAAGASTMRFAPDTLRPPTHFVADVRQPLAFREAMAALHQVVVADLRFKPKDRSVYFAWLQNQQAELLAQFMARAEQLKAQIAPVQEELQALRKRKSAVMGPFFSARQQYFSWLYQANKEAWFVLDPVITVHPDRVLFEAFSQDESSYGLLSCEHGVFNAASDIAFGTTNVDYSDSLHAALQQVRDYRPLRLNIDPSGFGVSTGQLDGDWHEPKIDVPESWVRGFLQVSSAMTLPAVRLHLHPMDIHNIVLRLVRRRERVGPRSLRFILKPGEGVQIAFDPWGDVLQCPRSRHDALEAREIRIWGRRRLQQLERLIPLASGFTVHLLGSGMPSFWQAHLPGMQFTLGLSGWSANDWSRQGNFSLLQPRQTLDAQTHTRVFAALAERWVASTAVLCQATGLDSSTVTAALGLYVQAGRVLFDLGEAQSPLWRLRELTREPLPLDQLRYASVQEGQAVELVQARALSKVNTTQDGQYRVLTAVCKASISGSKTLALRLVLDNDQRIVDGRCECDYFFRNKLMRGPCEHLLGLRMAADLQATPIVAQQTEDGAHV